MKKIIKIVSIAFILSLFVLPVSAQRNSTLKVVLPKKTDAYLPGDSMQISWTPASTPIQTITLISTEKKNPKRFSLYSNLVSGDPVITSGKFNYTFENYSIPAGSYYVALGLPGSQDIATQSSKKITVENRPSVYFGTINGEVNLISVSPRDSVTLKWDVTSVKKCKASSFPENPKWKGSVSASGTKTIRVLTSTTFFLNCKNNLGELTSSLEVSTQAPDRSNANLVPSTTFINYGFKVGTTQQEALTSLNTSMTLFNSSATLPIYYRIITDNQPSWINSGFNTAQMVLPPLGVSGIGVFADPSRVFQTGTYTWDLKLEGNFANSPLVIPVTMKITK